MEVVSSESQNQLENIEEFLNNSTCGVVYVSIGSNITQNIQQILIETMRDLKQNFIWNIEQLLNEKKSYELPSNVKILHQFPHKHISSRKNISLCIINDDTLKIKKALHYGVPVLIIPFQNNKIHNMVKTTVFDSISTIRLNEINRANLMEKINILSNSDSRINAKEIASMLHHNSINLLNGFAVPEESNKTQQISTYHLHLDALGALFFVIFVVVKLSLKFCRFYNNFEWKASTASKKTK